MQAPSYEEVACMMSTYGDPLSAAECHGILSGMLCCHLGLDGSAWAQRMLTGELSGDEPSAPVGGVDANDKELLRVLFETTREDMLDPDLAFQLLLPDAESDLEARTIALGEWCEGFLYGLSAGGIKNFDSFSQQLQEFCKDLVDISNIAHDVDESDGDSEKAFFEISEYVRMGTLAVHDELGSLTSGPDGSGPGGEQKITFH